MKLKDLWALAFIPFVLGCGSTVNMGPGPDLGGSKYTKVESGTLQQSGKTLSGTGRIVFNDPLTEVGSNKNFDLSFSLEDGSSFTLITHSTNKLEQGVEVRFSRQGTSLKVTFRVQGSENDVSDAFLDVVASGPLRFFVDAHNSESPAHFLIWKGDATSFDEENALLNSESDGMAVPGNGSGNFWGMSLENATLIEAAVGDAKFVEAE